MTTANTYFDMNAAPMRIGVVRLKVRDLDRVSAFYQALLGLDPVENGTQRVTLAGAGTPLLELVGDPALAPHDPHQAGLFHTAFLMPTRADLARWVTHASTIGTRFQGASDHIVSEALYLSDPEGNGIEVYADRPVANWYGSQGEIHMATEPLDMADLLKSATGTEWNGFPHGGRIGHVHLQVGDTDAADRFYRDVLGFDIAANYPGASFYGSGDYHHQLAGNIWNSRRAGERSEDMAGLDRVKIILRDAAALTSITARATSTGIAVTKTDDGAVLRDPWGTTIALRV